MTIDQLLTECDVYRTSPEKLALCKPFSCNNEDLDEFFAKNCLINQRKLLGKTYLFCLKSQPNTIVLEAKYMGIGINRLPLNTRLMYFDLLNLNVNK